MASPGSVAQWHDEVDVLIAGFGVAGCAAALGARDADAAARILIVEKMPEHLAGGNGRVSGQSLLISHDAEALYRRAREMWNDLGRTEDGARVDRRLADD